MEVKTAQVSQGMKRVISQAIEKAQKKVNGQGAFYLDLLKEIDSSHLPDQFMDIEAHLDTNLIDLVKCEEVFFS